MFYSIQPKTIALCLGVLLMVFLLNYLVLAWTEPSSNPPAGNVPAPLNVGNIGQSKSGGLILNTGGAATGLVVDKGNVGIGTAVPTGKLDVLVAAADVTTSPLVVGKGASNYVTVLNNGNVGIGTTGPSQKLEVNGSGLFTGDVCNGAGKCLSSVFQTNVLVGTNPACPTGQIVIMKAYNGTWYTADNASITTWSQVACGVKMCADGSLFLVNQAHCAKNCTDLGGTVVGDGSGNNMCRFNAEVCPSTWVMYNGWTTTYGTYSCTCTGTGCCSDTAIASYNCGGPCATPCTGGHAWSNNGALESVTCGRSGVSAHDYCAWCDCCCCTRSVVRSQIGCY